MPTNFCLSVRFLQPYSHGRGGDGEPEWPPSPLRAFQALVAAAAARWNERIRLEYAVPALRWLERQPAPTIVAARGVRSDGKYRLYVPDNVADKVARSWSRGRHTSIADYRTEKDVRPTRLLGDVVHYLFPVAESDAEFEKHRNTLIDAALSITHLGWGVDVVVGNATVLPEEEAAKLPGERWLPTESASAGGLRVPVEGTVNDLATKHAAFLDRLSGDGFQPVPPLSAYRVVGYRLAIDPRSRPFAAFTLLTPDAERTWGRDARRAIEVAGMVRHAAKLAALAAGKPQTWIETFVLGHGAGRNGQAVGTESARRFSYVPLPTVRPQGVVGIVNRILIVEPPGGDGADAAWARRILAGRELLDDKGRAPVALLSPAPASDWVVRQYAAAKDGSPVWFTVTPVVLPGYDDPDHLRRRLGGVADAAARRRSHERLDARIDGLLRKAIVHAGFSADLARHAELSWRLVGYRPGLGLATQYRSPDHLRGKPRYHVRVEWKDASGGPVNVRGPVVLGVGRHYGLGLFLADR
jgi:CRISPR-associated protein Csb2